MSTTAIPSHPLDAPRTSYPAASSRFLHHAPPRPLMDSTIDTDVSLECADLLAIQRAQAAIQRRRHQFPGAVDRYRELGGGLLDRPDVPRIPGGTTIHLNPLRAWCRLRTSRFLQVGVAPPATVLLFAVGEAFDTRVFDLEGQTMMNVLADFQPCTLDQWSTHSALATRDQLIALCRELSAVGLLCYGSPDARGKA